MKLYTIKELLSDDDCSFAFYKKEDVMPYVYSLGIYPKDERNKFRESDIIEIEVSQEDINSFNWVVN